MNDDSDQEVTELDVETRTWNKLETKMKLFGFREGAVEGKNLSLQEGFNLGYLDGFKLGEYLGMRNGIINCESELKVPRKEAQVDEQAVEVVSSQQCVSCTEKNKKTYGTEKTPCENLEDLIKMQQSYNNEIINALKDSYLKPYFDKG